MPISGIVIRLVPGASRERASLTLAELPHVELAEPQHAGLCAVIDAPDYPAHDAALAAVAEAEGVCTVDLVFHDFSDVTEFGRLPARRRRAG